MNFSDLPDLCQYKIYKYYFTDNVLPHIENIKCNCIKHVFCFFRPPFNEEDNRLWWCEKHLFTGVMYKNDKLHKVNNWDFNEFS